MERLFMLEVLVDNILFGSGPMPQKKQVIVYVRCGTFANLEIRTDVMGALETQEPSSKRKDIDINCGKSYVFPMVPKTLKELLKTCPLQFDVSTKLAAEPFGTANMKWDEAFIELAESAEDSIGYLTPVEYRDYISLTKKDEPVGGLGFYIRLTYLGTSIDTHIQIVDKAPADGAPGTSGKQYLFKGNNNATTFQCEKVGLGSDTDVIPVAPIYGTADRAPQQAQADFRQSLMSMMGGTIFSGSMQSLCPSVFGMDNFQGPRINLDYFRQMSTVSTTQSLRDMVPGKLFLDIAQLQAAFGSLMGIDELGENYEELTIEEIEKRLCKNKDCPAAKLFKNYGIGPLAKGNGLGGVYKDVEAPIAYSLSHVNGKIDNYGPLGTYSRPKRPENDFVAKKEEPSSSCVPSSRCKSKNKCESPLRLSGGSPICGNTDKIPDPRHAFSDLMEDFNKLLVNYKNALGPCNDPTCPFAPNVVAEACRKVCRFDEPSDGKIIYPVDVLADIAPEMLKTEISACGAVVCPFKRDVIYPADKDHKKTQAQPACRSPTCPYMRANLGLEEIDDMHMPPVPCPGKNCPFKVPNALPPIHWDCPDPLPVGDCKNPDCPLVKKDKLLEKYFPQPKSVCGSPTCPFTIQPCLFPGCPFNVATDPCPPFCPYAKPVPSELECNPTICPFARTSGTDVCKKSKCPYSDKSDGNSAVACCDNPKCPYQTQKSDKIACDNPQCPYQNKEPSCDNPKCPYQNQKKDKDACDNPQCPYEKKRPVKDACDNPKCPYENQEGREDTCSNPKCPYETEAAEIECDNPECPFNKSEITDNLCSNPKCPFKGTKKTSRGKKYDNCGNSKDIKDDNDMCGSAKEKTCGPDIYDDECSTDKGAKQREDVKKDEKGGGEGKVCKSAPGSCPPQCSRLKSLQKGATAQSESGNDKKKKGRKKKKKRSSKRSGYVYNKGTYYPGNKIGHVECINPIFRVPPDMGWLWNIHTACLRLRPRRGWKPGAISKTIAARINEHRRRYGMQPLAIDPKKRRRKAGGGFYSSEDEMDIKAKPTLQVKKKDGIVYVTMNPLKDPQTLEDNENPYMDCSPMQFKIVKNKQPDKNGGYTCLCDGEEPPDISNSSSSELEVEFTPPAGIIRPQRFKKKKNVCHIDTQYMIDDIVLPVERKGSKKKAGGKGKKGKK